MHKSACITIHGKIFVDTTVLAWKILENNPDYEDKCIDDFSPLNLCTAEEEKAAFNELAQEAIGVLIPADDPVKVYETEIDLDTYK